MVDYDEIRAGRRRDWWKRREAEKKAGEKLSPSEEMARILEEADQEEEEPDKTPSEQRRRKRRDRSTPEGTPPDDLGLPGPPPDPTLLDTEATKEEPERKPRRKRYTPHERRYAEERERGLEEWQKTKKQLILLGIIAGSVLVVVLVVSFVLQLLAGGREQVEMARYMKMAGRKEIIHDLSTPVRALATYRSAWLRGDMRQIWKMTSPAIKKDILAARSESQHILDQLHLYTSGSFASWVDVMKDMNEPEFLFKPAKPYRDGELAVFRTQPYTPPQGNRIPIRYAISFAYNDGEWQFFQSTPETSWVSSWDTIYDAKPGATLDLRR